MAQRKAKQEEREGERRENEGHNKQKDKSHNKRNKNQKNVLKDAIATTDNKSRQSHHHHIVPAMVVEESTEELAKLDLESNINTQGSTSLQRHRLKLAPRTKPIPKLDIDKHYVNEIHTSASGENSQQHNDAHNVKPRVINESRNQEEKHTHIIGGDQKNNTTDDDGGGGNTITVEKILSRPPRSSPSKSPPKRDRGLDEKQNASQDDEIGEDTNRNVKKSIVEGALIQADADCSTNQPSPIPFNEQDTNTDEEREDQSVDFSSASEVSSGKGRGTSRRRRGGGKGRGTGRGRNGRNRGRGGKGKDGSFDEERSSTCPKNERRPSLNKARHQPPNREDNDRPPKPGSVTSKPVSSLSGRCVEKPAIVKKNTVSPYAFTIGANTSHSSNSNRIKMNDKVNVDSNSSIINVKGKVNGELQPNGTVRLSRNRSSISKDSASSGGYSINSSRKSGRGKGAGRGRGKSRGRGRGGGRSHSEVIGPNQTTEKAT